MEMTDCEKPIGSVDMLERFCELYYCETWFPLPFLLLSLEGWCQTSTSDFSCDRLLEPAQNSPKRICESRQSIACLTDHRHRRSSQL